MARHTKPSIFSIVILIIVVIIVAYSRSHQSYTPSPSSVSPVTAPTTSVSETANAKCHMHGLLPDPSCTPGVTDPRVTQANIDQTICVSGYTKTVRPPVKYTDKLKIQQMAEYGFMDSISKHEEDHLISLEIGGSPTDPHNLWPEPGNSPNPKDKVEDYLHTAVCSGSMSLADAQKRIATDWTTAESGQ